MKIKRFISVVITAIMAMSAIADTSAMAADGQTAQSSDAYYTLIYNYTKAPEETEKEFQEEMSALLANSNGIEPQYDHYRKKMVYGTPKTITVKGYAGNQVSGGYRFPTGGGFYFSDLGGPSIAASVSFSAPYIPVSFGVSLGISASSGKFVTVPNNTDYFKLYIEKSVEVKPYVIYEYINNQWVRYSSGATHVVVNVSAYAKKV